MNPDDLGRALILCALYAVPGSLYGLTLWVAGRRARRRSAQDRAMMAPTISTKTLAELTGNDPEHDVDAVAQAIARCYGHGPLHVMDQHYQDEFRRDARAAIAVIRRRGSA
jgi:hypothetical protein